MNRGLWIARKNYLFTLMRSVSEAMGGDELDFFEQHCKDIISSHQDESIEKAIACYEDIKKSMILQGVK